MFCFDLPTNLVLNGKVSTEKKMSVSAICPHLSVSEIVNVVVASTVKTYATFLA